MQQQKGTETERSYLQPSVLSSMRLLTVQDANNQDTRKSIVADTNKANQENIDPNIISVDTEVAPSPLDFDIFVPWFCNKMGIQGSIVVIRIQAIKQNFGKSNIKTKTISETTLQTISFLNEKPDAKKKSFQDDRTIIHAHYDASDRLTELYIKDSNYFTQKHIKVVNLCLPFHTGVTKFTLTKCTTRQEVLYELGQLLSVSNITEVILDDTYCTQGNYYILLEYANKLKRLSLNRCSLNDNTVLEIFKRLEGDAAKPLQILELSSNFITVVGAKIIGNTLRTNRELLHLNLAGNRINDKGVEYILNSLMKFELTGKEVMNERSRKLKYYKKKMLVFQYCYNEKLEMQRRQYEQQSQSAPSSRRGVKSAAQTRVTTFTKEKKELDITQYATKKTNQIMGGPYRDVYDSDHVIVEEDRLFCTGNFKLVSLNIAYNRMGVLGLKTILKVLEYQADITVPIKIFTDKGLMRIVVDGNNIDPKCDELEMMAFQLNKKIKTQVDITLSKSSKSCRILPSRTRT